jgi:1-acyl-sn-glycerol-3-phosphate acyltransferase
MLHTLCALLSAGWFLSFGGIYPMHRLKRISDPAKRDQYALETVQKAMHRLLKVSGVTFEVQGLEHVPEDEPVLFVGNHRSFFDVIIGYTLVRKPTGFIAKIELAKVKPLKRWMEYVNCLFLDRDDLKQNLKVIIDAIKNIRAGRCSYWIYPEGTRSKGTDPRDMLPFKAGSFKIAEKTGCKIIPVAMTGTREILEAHFPKIVPGHVKVSIGEPIVISELPEDERKHLGEYTRNVLIRLINDMEKG